MAADYFSEETIASIITAANAVSAIGVIRVSGPGAIEKISPILRKTDSSTFTPEKIETHKLYRCVVQSREGQALDDGMLVWMKGPHSFTGEDVVELHLHGNPYLLRKILNEIQHCGVRAALPGEFSFRAFRNGRLSLDQAESIADLIGAQSTDGARRSVEHLLGRNKDGLSRLKAELVNRLAEIEVDIDFSDQGLSVLNYELWVEKLEAWCSGIEETRKEFLLSQPLREGVKLALFGAPNSGKSSLFNRILGEDRSIVNQEAGTTRDVVRESIYLDGLLLRISDTAGIRETGNEIESEGIERSFGEIRGADLMLWVLDGHLEKDSSLASIEQRWGRIQGQLVAQKMVVVWNKSDLSKTISSTWATFMAQNGLVSVVLSAKTGAGFDSLRRSIVDKFQKSGAEPSFLISRTRHYEVLGSAVIAVRSAIERVGRGETFPDLLASDLREALSKMGEITGEFTSDDLLRHIFAEFCIGK